MKYTPPSQYFGGKQEFIDWYLEHMPTKGVRTGVEVCGGMASWTLAREQFPNDVINDGYEFIADLFKGIRDDAPTLAAGLAATPHSRTEWLRARQELEEVKARRRAGKQPTQDAAEIARLFLVVLRQSLATAPGKAWSRIIDHSRREMCSSCSRWIDAPENIIKLADRLKTVQIECMGFNECIKKYDRKTTLFFIDPPYLESVRKSKADTYMMEFTKADHVQLLGTLKRIKGQAMVCGYDHPLYNSALKGWTKHQYKVKARTNVSSSGTIGKSSHRIETLWVKSHAKSTPR